MESTNKSREMDETCMKRALELAARGSGWTSPNPLVGAVLVKEGRVIGEGWHQRYGDLHAEREALQNCQEDPAGADLYVTLEPCCHTGKQPPCTEAIVKAGIKRVVVGCLDSNPLVSGKGMQILKEQGIEVETGVLEEECRQLNRVFFHFMQKQRPYVTLKFAMTLDGKIATSTGDAKWITGETARKQVHETRHQNRAIMVGIGTVLADDPRLDCRLPGKRSPIRIVCDTHLRTPLDSQLMKTASEIPLIVAAGKSAAAKAGVYQEAGCQVWLLEERNGKLDLQGLLKRLGKARIDSLLLEGGGTLNGAMLEAGLVDRIQAYIAPKLIGGNGKSPVQGNGVSRMAEALALENVEFSRVGDDFLLEGDVPGREV